MTLSGSVVSGNEARIGGGLYNISGDVELNNSQITFNTASEDGGGLFNQAGTSRLTVVDSYIIGNTAPVDSDCFGCPNPPAADSLILFESSRSGNGEIYRMDQNGNNVTNLTNDTSSDGSPTWSKDRTKIAFTRYVGDGIEIFSMNADGSNPFRITNSPGNDWNPRWSQDGTRLVFNSVRDGTQKIYIANADGTGVGVVFNNFLEYNIPGNEDSPDWSPDGSKIAFSGFGEPYNNKIYVMNINGSNVLDLRFDQPTHDQEPSWSPDGSKIAYKSGNASAHSNDQIYVMDSDGENKIRLSNNSANDSMPSWSPDGTKIVFQSDRNGVTEIYVMDSDGSNEARLTYDTGAYPSWSQ